ncbi:MAG: flagellar motor protein MotB [Candidatus Omnitrophota bacterium]|nr:OmpA family protein [Candidatus Omnitrophota bacterium]MBU2528824.1 OmpA family protein [bacterium]MBU3930399.1 OmpA family protein [bacterium]MBU4122800.1 OmpA family protein [bacterium]
MAKKKTSQTMQVGPAAPGWMVTYGDLMTQLLIFFVMMFALASAMNELQLINLQKKMRQYVDRENLTNDVSLDVDERGLVVSFHGNKMYEKGDAEIKPEALKALSNLAAFVRPQPNEVRIEAHADMTESPGKYISLWNLSSTRASFIAKQLIQNIYFPPYRLSSAGYAEQKPYIKKDGETYKTLEARSADLLKTASSSFFHEVTRMTEMNINNQVLEKNKSFEQKYKNDPNHSVLVRMARNNYQGGLERKYAAISLKMKESSVFKDRSGKWAEEARIFFKFADHEIEILAAKEDYIKAQFYDRLQKEIVTMANLSPSQQNRNRRVDIIIARISPQAAKERLL